MGLFTLSDAACTALAGFVPGGKPARAPVLRGSMEAGTFEDRFFAVPEKGETDRLLKLARAALDAGRRAKRLARREDRELTGSERTLAALTAGAVRVFETICTLARLNKGRVFPTYAYLAEATALGRATVARALAALEKAGFLARQRRFRRVAGDGPGPRYTQTSNVYRPILPRELLTRLPRWTRPVPLPDDVIQRDAERRADIAAMQARLSCRDLAHVMLDGPLRTALAKLGATIDLAQRESQNNPQTNLDSVNGKPDRKRSPAQRTIGRTTEFIITPQTLTNGTSTTIVKPLHWPDMACRTIDV